MCPRQVPGGAKERVPRTKRTDKSSRNKPEQFCVSFYIPSFFQRDNFHSRLQTSYFCSFIIKKTLPILELSHSFSICASRHFSRDYFSFFIFQFKNHFPVVHLQLPLNYAFSLLLFMLMKLLFINKQKVWLKTLVEVGITCFQNPFNPRSLKWIKN